MRSRAHFQSHPLHPMLVAFPIGLWVFSFVFDLLGRMSGNGLLWAAGFYCVVAGCVMAALAAIPGVIDLFLAVPPSSSARQRGYIHGLLNSTALLLFIAIAIRRGGSAAMPDNLSLFLSAIGVLGIAISGWLGGTLVYRNQIGVDHRYAGAGQFKERTIDSWQRPAAHLSELADGQMMLVKIAGERVVLARCRDGMFAFSDHCTHKGGPLSDGALVGCMVQCPWHGSQFDVATGRVVAGPAQQKIETYTTDVRNGEVYIIRSKGEIKKVA
ncbi:MAG TPA: DUF2231 domain-containing protein [Terriglobales bacterium]|jgi:nitrite reductase/ring-hydroxylating ferredoxin subunit/uncharacterized membrane protein|nr:DUF2231 domain-containing protein [Terriglobales bacterium]